MKLELRKPKQVLMQRPLLRLHPDGLRFYERQLLKCQFLFHLMANCPAILLLRKCKNHFASFIEKIYRDLCRDSGQRFTPELSIPLEAVSSVSTHLVEAFQLQR